MQTTNQVAALLHVPAASVRRMKQELQLTEDFHFIKDGNRLMWTPEGVDELAQYVHDNPFSNLLNDGDLFEEEEYDAA
jgi:hypothetical protein